MMRRTSNRLSLCRRSKLRQGMSALEVVMTTAVMLPLAGFIFFLGAKMCSYMYGIISALVGWPYL